MSTGKRSPGSPHPPGASSPRDDDWPWEGPWDDAWHQINCPKDSGLGGREVPTGTRPIRLPDGREIPADGGPF